LNFISIHGPHAGVASVPRCDPGSSSILRELCDLLDYLLGDFVYTSAIQTSVAQSNYFRDPFKISQYMKGCLFLPTVLEQAPTAYKDRLVTLKHLVLLMAERDTMIFPKESEYFGAFSDESWELVIPAHLQPWYKTLGLQDLENQGRLVLLTTKGDHLQFSRTELYGWIDQYFIPTPAEAETEAVTATNE